jgi:hypothetical protein
VSIPVRAWICIGLTRSHRRIGRCRASGCRRSSIQISRFGVTLPERRADPAGGQIGYARASYASGGGGASCHIDTSRVPRIAGDVTAGPALVSCVLAGYAPCAERRRL